jgi:adenylate cyclase
MRFRLRDMKRKVWPVGVGLAITFFHLYWMNTSNPILIEIRQRLDWIIYDMRLFYNLEDNPEPSQDIVLIDMDERSLSEQGRWPWSRLVMADLINKLGDAGVVVTAIDVSFPEPENNPATQVIRYVQEQELDSEEVVSALERAEIELDADGALAGAVAGYDVIPGYLFINDGESKGAIPHPVVTSTDVPARAWGIRSASGYIANIPEVTEAAVGSGFYSVLEDDDGTLRRYNMLFEHNGDIYSSLALETIRLYMFADEIEIIGTQTGDTMALEGVRVADLEIPLDQYGQMLIPFRGRSGQFPTVSATDVIEGRVDPAELEGRIAFIGSTAMALFDFRSTPVQSQFPGLEVHPTIAQGILDQNIPHQPSWGYGITVILVLGTGVLFSFILPFLSAPFILGISLVYLAGYAFLNNWAWSSLGWAMDATIIISLVVMQSVGVFVYGFVSERFARLQVTDMFGQYVPPELVEQMSKSPDNALSFDGDRREMTVLFADIRNFTSISEGMEPAQLKDMLNRYFTPMTKIIFDNRGTIDKYIGDLVMAFWGAPLDDPDHAKNALMGAMEMLEETQNLKAKFTAMGYPDIEIGIGLNSGEMNVGNMGSEYRRSYTVLGDNVNLGSRIEGLTKFYGAKLLVGENTYYLCQDEFEFCPVDKVLVKGKEEPVTLYEPLGKKDDIDPETLFEMESYQEALEAYYQGYWEDAHRQFFILSKLNPDRGLYKVYAERTSGEHEPPAEGWDGVFRHTSK